MGAGQLIETANKMQRSCWGLDAHRFQGVVSLVNVRACLCPRHRGNGLHGTQQLLLARKACSLRAGVRTYVKQSTQQAGLAGPWSSSQTISPGEPMASASEVQTTADAPPAKSRRRHNPETPSSPICLPDPAAQRQKRADYAPGTRVGEKVHVLLARQLRDLMKNPIPGISVEPDEDNIKKWHVVLTGPEGSPYAGGLFEVELRFTSSFPGKQPGITFYTPIWHPNITETGQTCVALGESDPYYWFNLGYSGHYKVRSAACVLIGLQMLLSTPNPDNCLNGEAGGEMRRDREAFYKKAVEWTRIYATEKQAPSTVAHRAEALD